MRFWRLEVWGRVWELCQRHWEVCVVCGAAWALPGPAADATVALAAQVGDEVAAAAEPGPAQAATRQGALYRRLCRTLVGLLSPAGAHERARLLAGAGPARLAERGWEPPPPAAPAPGRALRGCLHLGYAVGVTEGRYRS